MATSLTISQGQKFYISTNIFGIGRGYKLKNKTEFFHK